MPPSAYLTPVVHYRLGPGLLACRTPGASPHSHFAASEDRTTVTCRSCLRVREATLAQFRALVAEAVLPRSTELVATPQLRTWREYVALSQADLARGAGVSASTIRRLERGGRTNPDLAARLTTFLQEEDARQQAWCQATDR
jgi:DNA-binding XRE family transcriptional regulator